jgi:hypothetical protein
MRFIVSNFRTAICSPLKTGPDYCLYQSKHNCEVKMETHMDIDKRKIKDKDKDKDKNDSKKMPEINRSRSVETEKPKENQDPNEFSHKLSKEETYE